MRWRRLRLDHDRQELRRTQTGLNSCLNRCPILRYFLGVLLLSLTLLVLEAAAITALDVSIHNTGPQRGFVMTEGSLQQFNILNMILSLSCEAGTGTFVDIYVTVARFAGLAILTLYIVFWYVVAYRTSPLPVMLTTALTHSALTHTLRCVCAVGLAWRVFFVMPARFMASSLSGCSEAAKSSRTEHCRSHCW